MAISKTKANALWSKLASQLLDFEQTLKEIIQAKAWEPMGYETFADAWNDKMSDITLFKELRPLVVWKLLAEGLDVDEAADAVKGVGPDTARVWDRQRRAGVEPEGAELSVVSEHYRRKPCRPDTLHLKIGETMLAEYQRVADVHGLKVEQIAKTATAARFKELAAEKPRRRRAV